MDHQQERFKLDAAAVNISGRQQQRIIVYNFNIPIDLAQDPANWEIVRQQILTDLPPAAPGTISQPYFQLTAVYTLIHRNTNEERLWLGSFNPRGRELSQITAFRPVDHETFVDYSVVNSEPIRVRNRLDSGVNTRDSVWTLGNILSIIASFQSTVSTNHLINHPELLTHSRHGAKNRRNVFRIYYD